MNIKWAAIKASRTVARGTAVESCRLRDRVLPAGVSHTMASTGLRGLRNGSNWTLTGGSLTQEPFESYGGRIACRTRHHPGVFWPTCEASSLPSRQDPPADVDCLRNSQ